MMDTTVTFTGSIRYTLIWWCRKCKKQTAFNPTEDGSANIPVCCEIGNGQIYVEWGELKLSKAGE